MPVEKHGRKQNKTTKKVTGGKKLVLGSFKLNEKTITHKYANVLLQSVSQYVQPWVRTWWETADGGAQGGASEDPELAHHPLPEAIPSLLLHLHLHQSHHPPVRGCRRLACTVMSRWCSCFHFAGEEADPSGYNGWKDHGRGQPRLPAPQSTQQERASQVVDPQQGAGSALSLHQPLVVFRCCCCCCYFCLFVFWDEVSLCSKGCPKLTMTKWLCTDWPQT